MKLLQKLLTKFDGLHYHQEYLCLEKESFQDSPRYYLINNGQVIKNVTDLHAFVGYSPLIFSFDASVFGITEPPDNIEIALTQQVLQPNEYLDKKDALALLSLILIQEYKANGVYVAFYEGVNCNHRLLARFHQVIIGAYNRLYNQKQGNVFLHNNLYRQVQIAYSIPRLISLITVKKEQLYNLFPTDLHGMINQNYYVSSLRHKGKACAQVLATGQIVLSQVDPSIYKTVYSLGKNHMQDLKAMDAFPFGNGTSPIFHLPIPISASYCRELEVIASFDRGIHKLFVYKIVSYGPVVEFPRTLSHIHNVYATWRHRNGLPGKYFLR